jgi:hypothetical protein
LVGEEIEISHQGDAALGAGGIKRRSPLTGMALIGSCRVQVWRGHGLARVGSEGHRRTLRVRVAIEDVVEGLLLAKMVGSRFQVVPAAHPQGIVSALWPT